MQQGRQLSLELGSNGIKQGEALADLTSALCQKLPHGQRWLTVTPVSEFYFYHQLWPLFIQGGAKVGLQLFYGKEIIQKKLFPVLSTINLLLSHRVH